MRAPTSSRVRVGIGALALSAAGLVAMVVNEGYSDNAIIPTKGDVPTYGFGMTHRPDGSRVQLGDKTNPVEALQRKLDYIQKDEAVIKRCVNVPLHPEEYEVYVDHAYNVGISGFCKSTIVKRLQAGDYVGACKAILMWRFAAGYDCSTPGNKRCWGLWERRLKSYEKCMAAQ